MINKDETELQIDLVFKCNKLNNLFEDLKINSDNYIFESSYWESVFSIWIRVIVEENNSSFPDFIFEKKIFSLSLEIVNDKKISSINQQWMKKSGPTDVLSFPIISEIDSLKDLLLIELGDIFISLEKAYNQSLEYKHSITTEMLWLASHGFLHLLGWDHKDDNALKNMLSFQEYLISKLK